MTYPYLVRNVTGSIMLQCKNYDDALKFIDEHYEKLEPYIKTLFGYDVPKAKLYDVISLENIPTFEAYKEGKMTINDIMNHLLKGGQVFRETRRGKFFYKLQGEELLCRCNELGGWHPAYMGPGYSYMERHKWKIATHDYDYKTDKMIMTPLPEYFPQFKQQ